MSRRRFNIGLEPRTDETPSSVPEQTTDNIIKRINHTQPKEETNTFQYRYVKLQKLVFNEKNDYPIEEIEEMAVSLLYNGLQHNLVAKYDLDTDTYKLISGERRTRGLQLLQQQYEDGKQTDEWNALYQKNIAPLIENGIPVKLDDSTNDIDEEIRLHITNVDVRELSASKKAAVVARLKELYQLKAERGELTESVSTKIASDLKITERQVRQYNTINKKLIPELKEEFDKNNITVKDGSKFAQLDCETQKTILEMIKAGQKVGQDELAILKKEKELTENRLKDLENSLSEKAALIEEQQLEKEEIIRHNEELINSLKASLEEAEDSTMEHEEELRQQLEIELQEQNQQVIEELQETLKTLQEEKIELARSINSLERESSEKKAEIQQLQKELAKQSAQTKEVEPELTADEKKQLRIKYELEQLAKNITNLLDSAEKKIEELSPDESSEETYVLLLNKLLEAR